MAFNILSGSIANYNLEASGSFSGSFAGDGTDLINVEQFKTQNQGDKRVLFYKLNGGEFELNSNSNFKFNPSTEVLTIPETTASTLNVTNDFTVDTNAFHVDATNNRIGVGTVTPTSIAGVSTFIELSDPSSAGIVMHDTGGTEWAIYSADSSLIITANATRRMTLLENGNVGIGENNPTTVLHVGGELLVNTSITASTANLTGLSARTAVATKYLALDSNNNIVLTSSTGTGGGGGGGGGISYSRRFVTSHATSSNSDTLIGISASAPLELRLASAAVYENGQYFIVKDEAGNSNTYNIAVKTSGSQTIDGQNSILLESPFAAVTIYSNGTDKFFIY